MTPKLEDLWLPDVEAEYLALLDVNKDVCADVGNQFRAFDQVLRRGVDKSWRSIDRTNSAEIYVMYGRYALMFFAVQGMRVAVVKWTILGNEYEQSQAREEAIRRATQLFP